MTGLAVGCPLCGAAPHDPCRSLRQPSGDRPTHGANRSPRTIKHPHPERTRARWPETDTTVPPPL